MSGEKKLTVINLDKQRPLLVERIIEEARKKQHESVEAWNGNCRIYLNGVEGDFGLMGIVDWLEKKSQENNGVGQKTIDSLKGQKERMISFAKRFEEFKIKEESGDEAEMLESFCIQNANAKEKMGIAREVALTIPDQVLFFIKACQLRKIGDTDITEMKNLLEVLKRKTAAFVGTTGISLTAMDLLEKDLLEKIERFESISQ